jgi:hypothetical protein
LGSLTVTASQNLAGIALEHYTLEDHATVLQATRGLIDNDRDTTLYAPINKNYRYNRFTGLTVQNAGSGSITITVIYYFDQDPHCPQSGQVTVTTPNVASGVSVTFPSTAFPTGCFASTRITASNGGGSDPNKAIVLQDMRLKPASFWNGTAMTPSLLGCAEGIYNGCGANGVFSVILTSDQNIVGIANESTYPFETPLISQDKSNYEAFNLPTPTP